MTARAAGAGERGGFRYERIVSRRQPPRTGPGDCGSAAPDRGRKPCGRSGGPGSGGREKGRPQRPRRPPPPPDLSAPAAPATNPEPAAARFGEHSSRIPRGSRSSGPTEPARRAGEQAGRRANGRAGSEVREPGPVAALRLRRKRPGFRTGPPHASGAARPGRPAARGLEAGPTDPVAETRRPSPRPFRNRERTPARRRPAPRRRGRGPLPRPFGRRPGRPPPPTPTAPGTPFGPAASGGWERGVRERPRPAP